MLAVAVFVSSILLGRDAKRRHIQPDVIFDLVFWMVVVGILGARVFYILLNFSFFWDNPLEMIKIYKGGLAWQGALVSGFIAGLIFIKKKGLALWPTLDLVAPYAALGQAIGRLGCFLNGCCYGKEWKGGVFFPVHQKFLHPTQLYEAFGLLIIFFILKRYQTSNRHPGRVFFLYLFLAGLERFLVEFLRADHVLTGMGLSLFQIISLIIMTGSIVLLWYRSSANFVRRK